MRPSNQLTAVRIFRVELANLQTRIRQFREREPLDLDSDIFLRVALENLDNAQRQLGGVVNQLFTL